MRKLMGCWLAVALLAGCKKEEPPAAVAPPPPASSPRATQAAGARVSGKVLETHPAGSYTYLRLSTAAGEQWAAVPSVEVKVGDEVVVTDPTLMIDFQSKTLGRTFKEITFGSGLEGFTGQPGEAKAPPKAAPLEGTPVEKATGPTARTIAELFADAKALEGKSVTVRARVVKFSPGIMSKNWIHLQDGTGTAANKDNDVTVTTQETVAVGDIVTLSGTVAVGKDIGAGYQYPVLIEDAKLVR